MLRFVLFLSYGSVVISNCSYTLTSVVTVRWFHADDDVVPSNMSHLTKAPGSASCQFSLAVQHCTHYTSRKPRKKAVENPLRFIKAITILFQIAGGPTVNSGSHIMQLRPCSLTPRPRCSRSSGCPP